MGVKRESEMMLVKEEEWDKKREDGSEEQGGEKRGKRQNEFFPQPTFCFCACAGGKVSILIWPSASA